MGNVSLAAFTGRKGILSARGYVQPGPGTTHLIPTLHPSFIQRGQAKYSAAFIQDLQKAVTLAHDGLPVEFADYVVDPSPQDAYNWAKAYRDHGGRLAYDIETPTKPEDEDHIQDDEDPSYFIWRVGFSYQPHTALSIPWTPPYIPAIRLLLESPGEKVVWNAGFDNPRIRHNGVEINGLVHDGMIAWHVLHSDLPKSLRFVATFTCPWQPAWKHLSRARPGFYNGTDADVEARSMDVIERDLRATGLWRVYERDVLDLNPILVHMTTVGMPIAHEIRIDRAIKLAERQEAVMGRMEEAVPVTARRHTPEEGYVRDPDDIRGCVRIRVGVDVGRCSRCGVCSPGQQHLTRRTLPRPDTAGRRSADRYPNPCLGAAVRRAREDVERWARLDPFKPSRAQLLRYQGIMGRRVPMKWDRKLGKKKPTMDAKAIKSLMLDFPDDPLYKEILWYRVLDKIAGSYLGRPGEDVSLERGECENPRRI
jgi:hypothetical protein